ncbi:carbonic anhydrase [Lysobacter korlensis]|uniref:Carbonic anhydrase n=1 Tax=Lysobacter korlensis TaxID=553636 RepID=A0ABV6RJH4_9GAMM
MSSAALRTLALGATGAAGVAASSAAVAAPAGAKPIGPPKTTLTPDQALQRLKDANNAFISDKAPTSPLGRKRRLELAQGQAPFAVLLSCSDSRVPPEMLFGQGLGDLFTVRVAGNTVSPEGLGSIEYAVAELGVPLIVVLGHERCGAVAAAVSIVRDGARFPGAIGEMVGPILPSAIHAKNEKGDWLDNAVRLNVVNVVERLKVSGKLLEDPIAAGKLRIVGARYDLDDGKVDFFHT